MGAFGERITELGDWQDDLSDGVRRLQAWLDDGGLLDPAVKMRFDRMNERLARRRLSVAFVAEFSRGKSELINALFFSDCGDRIVPSSAGRTTMCPTELEWNPAYPPSIRLLPIDTRLDDRPIAEWRREPGAWTERRFDPADTESLKAAFAAVRDVIAVDRRRADQLGFATDEDADNLFAIDVDGPIEVPRWRHALVNFPHPLLEAGLSIVDTPGLNAIGSEPELTLNTIPNADAVLFVLAADAGVTRSDVEVWRRYVSPSHQVGRFVVLNKIDGLWDDLKKPGAIDAEIQRQVGSVAATLGLAPNRVFPVSAQKALVARVHGDGALLERSRIGALEAALSQELVPQHQRILRDHLQRDLDVVAGSMGSILEARRRNAVEQLVELNSLQGKNRDVMSHMASRIHREREEFDLSLRQLKGLRAVFNKQSASLYTVTGTDRLKRHVREARESMRQSNLSIGLREGMNLLFERIHADLVEADALVSEICTMMSAMYKSFSAEHGLSLGNPVLFSIAPFREEIERVQALQRREFGVTTMVTTEKFALMRRFFESVAVRIKEIYKSAQLEIQGWLRTVMSPIESQVREYQAQLKRRLESVKRVLDANESLESRVAEIQDTRDEAERAVDSFANQLGLLRSLLGAAEPEPREEALTA